MGHISLDLEGEFKSGHLDYKIVNLSDREGIARLLDDSSDVILSMKATQSLFRNLLRENCDLQKIL